MLIEKKKTVELLPAEYNPRKDLKPGDEEYEKLKRSIEEFGYVEPVIWNKTTGRVVGGHQRLKVLIDLGIAEVDCVVVEMDDAKEKALNIALNKISGDWDKDKLALLIADLQGEDFDVSLTGFDPAEIDDLFKDSLKDSIHDDDFDVDEELKKPTFTKAGDIWTLGRHRLVCGDSTKKETYDTLMGDVKANLVITDPPYNVNYEGSAGKIKNDNMANDAFYQFLLDAFTNMEAVMTGDASIYVFHADTEGLNFRRAFADAGFYLSGCCIWKKQSLVLGRSPYQWQHEPVLYGWKKNGKHQWYTGRKETTIWEFDKPKKNGDHPTMKPIALLAYPIMNSSISNAVVLDPFGGSGSTLIACEQSDRICYTQSVTGNYSDVTLNVYLKYYTLEVGSRSDSTISINGTTETYTAPAITDYSSGQHTKLLKTKTVRVNHNADGTKSGVVLSAYWRFSGTYSGQSISSITATATVTLDTIDRTAPTVSLSTSSITASGVTISATSSATADIWQYSIDNGSTWTQFSTTAGTSASKAITGLSPNTTYYIKIKARKKSNQVYGTSSAATVKTLGGAVVNSVNQVTADAATVSIKLNVTVYDASYAYTLDLKNGSTTIVSVVGLTWSKGTADRTVTLTSTERTELLTAMANMKSFTGTFAVTTYSGGSTQIGSTSSKTATVTTTAANSGPTLSGFTYADSYATTTAITGNDQLFIQGHSKLTVTPGTATPKNQATIANYTATCNGVSVSNTTGDALTVGAVSKSGTVAVVLTITDSRGYTASVTQNITVLAYAKPKVNSLTLRRTNDIEAEMQLVFNGSISAITVDSVQKNSLLYVRYRYKATSATSYSSYVSILSAVTQSGTSFSYSNLELRSLAADQSWDVHMQTFKYVPFFFGLAMIAFLQSQKC